MATTKIETGLGYSPLTERVFYGRQNKAKQMWVGEKKDVTSDFIACSLVYYEENSIREVTGGKGGNNLVINIKNKPASIKMLIKNLQKRLK